MDIKEKRAEDIAEEVTENLDNVTYEAGEVEDIRKGIEETIVKVDNITVRFNIASERIDNMKEYFIKLIRKELMFKEFFALKDVSLEIKKGESIRIEPDWNVKLAFSGIISFSALLEYNQSGICNKNRKDLI